MEWIDARKQLPDKDPLWCLVFADGAINCAAWNHGRWEDWTNASDYNVRLSDVTHWMPLPDPPPKQKRIVEEY